MENDKCQVVSKKEPVDGEDFECVLKYNDKTVAIKSSGDAYYQCVDAIVKYANWDVLVLAYKNTFKRQPLDELVSKYAPPHCVVEKKSATDSDNERVCTEIIEQL
jgi:hypothetical protein